MANVRLAIVFYSTYGTNHQMADIADPHLPLERVHESAEVFGRMGGNVDERIYPRMGHTVNHDEIHAIQEILRARRVHASQ
jgi:predicted esterase